MTAINAEGDGVFKLKTFCSNLIIFILFFGDMSFSQKLP